ncbi:hypothetical protein KTQ83_00920 [Holdemanella porci]|jgi:hypothetical protein|nr:MULTISPECIES: hypothetical protein [Holdemanella]MBU9131269.1 hypothetical protein [Holdemanella porci]MBU9871087.1 hypothetical protein [Holdemanella porci]MBU9886116.1 hypothetical protein [Holdemanella porci]
MANNKILYIGLQIGVALGSAVIGMMKEQRMVEKAAKLAAEQIKQVG